MAGPGDKQMCTRGAERIPTQGWKMSIGDYEKGALRDICDAPRSRRSGGGSDQQGDDE